MFIIIIIIIIIICFHFCVDIRHCFLEKVSICFAILSRNKPAKQILDFFYKSQLSSIQDYKRYRHAVNVRKHAERILQD